MRWFSASEFLNFFIKYNSEILIESGNKPSRKIPKTTQIATYAYLINCSINRNNFQIRWLSFNALIERPVVD